MRARLDTERDRAFVRDPRADGDARADGDVFPDVDTTAASNGGCFADDDP